ncbi:MAG: hypothetical protein KAJ28_02715 [Flavobacteriaceae bacterium]|nr:hypothetical protein [Flavobacteriaceae bacterium]
MDELELLKKDWNKKGNNYPKLSYDEIYKMILKKSSSIVKWIFIISLLEFAFWGIISFALKDSDSMQKFKSYNVENIIIPLTIVGYIILAYFFYRFFMNYKTISVTDSARVLMENILKTRRTVKQYVAFNLIYLVLSTIVALFIEFDKNTELINKVEVAAANGETFLFYGKIIIVTALMLIVIVAVFLLFYWLIYGLLIKRLNKNYKELKKIEV